MPIPSTEQLEAAASKRAPCKLLTNWTSAALSKLTTKRTTSESTNAPASAATTPAGDLTSAVAKPILNAALLDGSKRHHFLAGERMTKALSIPRTHAIGLRKRIAKYSSAIIRNPRDLFHGCLPEFFAPIKRGGGRTEARWREMTGAELEEAGFAYGEDLEVLEMQGMRLIGWVAEEEEEEEE
ncbi:hypothetical protein V500_07506, partial [Pseudogymnoascus sp. VKM F-4518 (FW-2643)]